MAKKEKKLQKDLEKALRKGDIQEMAELLKKFGNGKSVHAEFEDFDEIEEPKKKKKKDKEKEVETEEAEDKNEVNPIHGLVFRPTRACSGTSFRAEIARIEKDDKLETRRRNKCKSIAVKQRDKILEDNPELDEEDIDIEEMTDTIYDSLYGNRKSAKSA